MGALTDFKTFIAQGNVVQLAVAFVIGMAFTAVVMAVVTGLVLPLISIPGNVNFATWTIAIGHGIFLVGSVLIALLTFLVVALVVFFGVVRPVAHLAERQAAKAAQVAATTRPCPECLSTIPIAAKRCSFCTSPVL
ncbi:MAG: MscL family protein [Thermoplasmata archaeon]|nr:MscL family protein [Thermoplasmata archaeon]